MQIINEIEGGKTKSDVSRQLGLASSTVATIWKNRDNILNAYGSGVVDPGPPLSINDEPLARLKECLPPDVSCRSNATPSPSKMSVTETNPMVGLETTLLVSGTNRLFFSTIAYHQFTSFITITNASSLIT